MTTPEDRICWQNSEWRIRLRRRQLVRRGELLSPRLFCVRKDISPACLLELHRRGKVFSVGFDRKRYFAAVLADSSFDQRRLEKLPRHLPPTMRLIVKYLFLVGRRGSLGSKSPLQAMRRAKRLLACSAAF
jgi:hypothetical protein